MSRTFLPIPRGEKLLHFDFCLIYNITHQKLMLLAFCSDKKIGCDGKDSFCRSCSSCRLKIKELEIPVYHDKILARICVFVTHVDPLDIWLGTIAMTNGISVLYSLVSCLECDSASSIVTKWTSDYHRKLFICHDSDTRWL